MNVFTKQIESIYKFVHLDCLIIGALHMTLSGLYPVRAEEEAQSTKNHARSMVQVVIIRTYGGYPAECCLFW